MRTLEGSLMWWMELWLESLSWWLPREQPITHEVIGIDFIRRRVIWRS
jgi:hypothetical protein